MLCETRNQRQERLMAERLKDAAHLGIREIVRRDPPHADVSLRLEDGSVVALEVRGLTDPARQESVSTKRRVGIAAEAALQGCRVLAQVHWETGILVPPDEAERLGKEIAVVVRAMLQAGRTELGDLEPLPASLQPYIAAMYLFPPGDGTRVRTSLESWEGIGEAELIQSALDEKERRLASYRLAEPGADVWLVLWTNAGESQPLHPKLLDPTHEYRSSFNRVFVLDYARSELTELKLKTI